MILLLLEMEILVAEGAGPFLRPRSRIESRLRGKKLFLLSRGVPSMSYSRPDHYWWRRFAAGWVADLMLRSATSLKSLLGLLEKSSRRCSNDILDVDENDRPESLSSSGFVDVALPRTN